MVDNLARASVRIGLAVTIMLVAGSSLQNAIAGGDTRTLTMHHVHTGETITVTYMRDGEYDEAALKKLDWFMRDWRRNEEQRMDPRLFDVLWRAYRDTDATKPIEIICGYRSPNTNAFLRTRSGGVAKFSQHILGKAIDFFIPGVPLAKLRAVGLQLQRGGVGFYPSSGSPFVHLDVGTVRHWPGISRQQLVKIFPDGRTVHIPRDGKPLPGYAEALAEIERRGNVPNAHSLKLARAAGAITEHDEQVAELVAQGHQQTLVALVESGRDNGFAKGEEPPAARASLNAIKHTSKKARIQVASAAPVPLPHVRPQLVTLASAQSKPLAAPVTTASAAGNIFDHRFWPGSTQNEAALAARLELASADMTTTGSTGNDALAYASDEQHTDGATFGGAADGRAFAREPAAAGLDGDGRYLRATDPGGGEIAARHADGDRRPAAEQPVDARRHADAQRHRGDDGDAARRQRPAPVAGPALQAGTLAGDGLLQRSAGRHDRRPLQRRGGGVPGDGAVRAAAHGVAAVIAALSGRCAA